MAAWGGYATNGRFEAAAGFGEACGGGGGAGGELGNGMGTPEPCRGLDSKLE